MDQILSFLAQLLVKLHWAEIFCVRIFEEKLPNNILQNAWS